MSDTLNGAFGEISAPQVSKLCQVFKLLSDETRLRILLYLSRQKELNVTELCARLGQSQPAVSHHLALMKVAGLIEPRKSGKHNFYSVRDGLLAFVPEDAEKPQVRFHDLVLSFEATELADDSVSAS